jgi:hypothetical protein
MYGILIIKAYQTGKETLLAGSFEPGLAGIQRKVFRTTIYHGPINIQGKQGSLEMYIVKRSNLIRNGIVTIWEAIAAAKTQKQKNKVKALVLPLNPHNDPSIKAA